MIRTPMRWVLAVAISLVAATAAIAQETTDTGEPDEGQAHRSTSTGALIPASREASGTAWLPDVSPMYGFHDRRGAWELMVHGNVFAQFLYESGEFHRRGHQFGSVNWFMAMAERPVGAARLELRAMVSLEPWTISGCGYPSLLATGEVCNRDTIHDRQHPHDLFMEIAAEYDRPLTRSLRWHIYGGPAGEPAIGPPAFPHRPSAFPNPIAPIGHHWLDATHITFGVLTTGIYGRRWKAEASVFNAREPDAARADFDLACLDSVSGRLSLAPTDSLSLQISAGHLKQAEAGAGSLPRTDVDRLTASAIYHRRVREGNLWATTLAYGRNSELSIIPGGSIHQTTHAVLLESSATVAERDTWFGRIEVVGKPAHAFHADEFITHVFTVAKLQAGYVRHLKPWNGLALGFGASASASLVPPLLAPRYGGRITPGFGVFVTVRPPRHSM